MKSKYTRACEYFHGTFEAWGITSFGGADALVCRAFFSTLKGNALSWFRHYQNSYKISPNMIKERDRKCSDQSLGFI